MTKPQGLDAPWYVRSFGKLYPLIYRHRDEASARAEITSLLERLALSGDEKVLDLCCGAGRHAVVVRDLGLDVVAVDLSPELLNEARALPALQGRLARCDMRSLPFPSGRGEGDGDGFDLVLNLFTSFGYFENDQENERAFREMTRVLRFGGRLVMDHMNRAVVERDLVPTNEEQRQELTLRHRRWITRDRVVKETTVIDGEGATIHFRESVRLYTPGELEELCSRCGLTLLRLEGSFHGEPFEPSSPRMILVAQKEDHEQVPDEGSKEGATEQTKKGKAHEEGDDLS